MGGCVGIDADALHLHTFISLYSRVRNVRSGIHPSIRRWVGTVGPPPSTTNSVSKCSRPIVSQ